MEEKDFKKSMNVWRGIAIALIIALLGVGVYSYNLLKTKNQYATMLQNQYQRAFRDLVTDVENVRILLDKADVSASTVQSNSLMTQLWQSGHSVVAERALSYPKLRLDTDKSWGFKQYGKIFKSAFRFQFFNIKNKCRQ